MPADRFPSTTAKYVDIPLAAKDGGDWVLCIESKSKQAKADLGHQPMSESFDQRN